MADLATSKVDYQDFDQDTTEFLKKLKRVLADINIRVAAVEALKSMATDFERRYGTVALERIDAGIAPLLADMQDALNAATTELAAIDAAYRADGQARIDDLINPLLADAQAALAAAEAQVAALDAFLADKQSVSDKGQAGGYAGLDGTGKVPVAQLPAAVLGAVAYQATWDAATNNPAIPAAAAGNKGHYYKVATAGATAIDGVNDWKVGDWIVSNGAVWEKIDNTDQVASVAGLQGAIGGAALKAALAIVTGDIAGLDDALAGKAANGHTHAFGDLADKPTTVAGYNITDVLGINQTWQNVIGSRASNTTYQNTSGKPIQVVMITGYTSIKPQVSPDGTTWFDMGTGGGQESIQTYIIVPSNWYYRMAGSVTMVSWMELR